MRKMVAVLAIAGFLALGSAAWAGQQISLDCIHMPGCCEITCVSIDVECCGCENGNGPLLVQFLDCEGSVLGTATFECGWCYGNNIGQLDTPVNANGVASVRLVKPEDDTTAVTWASLKVYCGDECHGKWFKVFKGDLWCWETIPAAPAAVPPPPPPPPAPVVEPPKSEWVPEPAPEPEPEPKPEPEVIVVPGRG
jgi:hypothetical protein